MQVNNKKIAKILLKLTLFIFAETFAPRFAVNILVEDTNITIAILIYPIENGGRSLMLDPEIIKIKAPGKAIKKPKVAEVPIASCIFFENIVRVGTLKLPPPIPIKTDKNPMNELNIRFIRFDLGRSFEIIIGSR